MRALTVFVVIVFVVFSVQQAAAQTVTIEPLEEGDSEVVISGYTVPQPITSTATVNGGTMAGSQPCGISCAMLVIAYLYIGTVFLTWLTVVQTSAPSTSVQLPSPWASGAMLLVVDVYALLIALVVFGSPSKDELPEPTFDVSGFAEGSSEITISALPVGATVRTSLITPGEPVGGSYLTDGGWSDQDGEANGTIVSPVTRWQGPPHVLSGEMLIVMLEGEEGGMGAWTSNGTGARLVIPVVSHIVGASGVPFVSDLTLTNPFGLDESGWIRFIPEGADWAAGSETSFALEPGRSVHWDDVLSSALGIDDDVKGTLVVGGMTTWHLQATSRNVAINPEGQRFGIAVPGHPTLSPLTPGEPWIVCGLEEHDEMRSNLVLAGAVPQASEVELRAVAEGVVIGSIELSVPGYGLRQLNRVAQQLGADQVELGYLELEVTSGAVFAALSVVDGSADDAALIAPRPLTTWR